jgi:tetratricopeptide (TPR) repeat protein
MISSRPGLAPDPELQVAHRALRTGRAATAEQMLRQLLKTYPVDPNARWLLGVALLDLGKAEDSVALLEALIHRADDFHAARVDLARAYRACGRLTEARHCVRAVLKRNLIIRAPGLPTAMCSSIWRSFPMHEWPLSGLAIASRTGTALMPRQTIY